MPTTKPDTAAAIATGAPAPAETPKAVEATPKAPSAKRAAAPKKEKAAPETARYTALANDPLARIGETVEGRTRRGEPFETTTELGEKMHKLGLVARDGEDAQW